MTTGLQAMSDFEVANTPEGEDDWRGELTERERQLLEKLETDLGGHRNDLERRHWLQALAALGIASAGSRELYRRQLLDALPDANVGSDGWRGTLRPDRNSLPDGVSSLGGFAGLLLAASVGGRKRARTRPLLSLLTAGVSLGQAIGSVRRLIDQFRADDVEGLTILETMLSAASVPLSAPEAVRAAAELVGAGHESNRELEGTENRR